MASYVKFYSFVEAMAEKVHNLGSDTLKVMLSNSAPAQSNTVKADITDISGGRYGHHDHLVGAVERDVQAGRQRRRVHRERWVDRAVSVRRDLQRHGG